MRVALDTNPLVYAEGVNGPDRRVAALSILEDHGADKVLIPAQALAELFRVLTRKAGMSAAAARARVLPWSDAYEVIETSVSVIADGMELTAAHRLSFWDALVIASAAAADCRLLLTEDMQDGFTWRGLTLRNPFQPSRG